MSTPLMPELPEPIRNKHGVPLFGSTQMHAYGLAVWKAAMEHAMAQLEAETTDMENFNDAINVIASLPPPDPVIQHARLGSS